MARRFALALLLLLLPSFLEARAPKAPVLFGGDRDFAPFEYLDEEGNPQGFDIDILKAVAETLQIDYRLELGPWNKMRDALESGRIDALVGMRYSPERDKLFEFSDPYLVNSSTIFVRKDSDIREIDDLRGRKIIVQRGDIMDEFVLRENLTPKITYVSNQVEALRLLASGSHDAALLTRLIGLYHIDRLGLNNLVSTGEDLAHGRYGFAVTEENRHLLEHLNEALRILKATGEYEAIYNRWFGFRGPPELWSEMLRYAVWVLTPVLLLLSVALVWSWTLRRQVAVKTSALADQMAERQRAETALESERSFRQLVMASPVPMIMVDGAGTILHLNHKFIELFDHRPGEAEDLKTWWKEACPDSPLPIDPSATHPEEVVAREMMVTGKSGDLLCIDCRFSSIEGHHIVVFNDITDRKRAEEALAYRAGVDELISVITARFVNLDTGEVDQEIDRALRDLGIHMGVDRSYLFQFSPDGRTMDNTHEWCAPGIESQIAHLQGLPTSSLPWFMNKLKEDEVFYCPSVASLGSEAHAEKEEWQRENIQSLITVSMMLKGRMVGFVGFDAVRQEQCWPEVVPFLLRSVAESFANALEHRRAETALRSAHDQMQDIIDFLPDATFVIDEEGKVVAWNRAIERMTGVPKEEMIGRGDHDYALPFYGERRPLLVDLVDRPKEELEHFYNVVGGGESGAPVFIEQYLPRLHDGRGGHIWATASRLFDRRGQAVGAIESIREISDRIEARKKLESYNREMEAFVSTVSHDLRTPLTPIIGYADHLRQAYGEELDPKARDYLERISTSGRKMLDMMEDLLTLASMGKLHLPEEPLDLGTLVRETVESMADAIESSGLRVIMGKLPSVRVPKTILSQIFGNLLGNAVRYASPNGGPVEIAGERQGEIVRFHVRDHGPGIGEEEQEQIFEAFYRGRVGAKHSGTGIGLAVVQKSACLYGGRAWVEKTPGGGATFVVEMRDGTPEPV